MVYGYSVGVGSGMAKGKESGKINGHGVLEVNVLQTSRMMD
jgi:hypothetical protein